MTSPRAADSPIKASVVLAGRERDCPAPAVEIIEDLAVLSDKASVGRPASGHFYVDMSTPTETLVVFPRRRR
jgi:hypothetical protein